MLSHTRNYKITAKGGTSPSCAQPMTVLHVYEEFCAVMRDVLHRPPVTTMAAHIKRVIHARAQEQIAIVSHCARTLTLTFVRTVDSRGAPRLLVEAGAAAVARLSAGVVLALALESEQKRGHVELAVKSVRAEVWCRYLEIKMPKL